MSHVASPIMAHEFKKRMTIAEAHQLIDHRLTDTYEEIAHIQPPGDIRTSNIQIIREPIPFENGWVVAVHFFIPDSSYTYHEFTYPVFHENKIDAIYMAETIGEIFAKSLEGMFLGDAKPLKGILSYVI